jgi:hypothetical protein
VPDTVWPLPGEVSETLGATLLVGGGGVGVLVPLELEANVTLRVTLRTLPSEAIAVAFSVCEPVWNRRVSNEHW